jgi:hypothetical protein
MTTEHIIRTMSSMKTLIERIVDNEHADDVIKELYAKITHYLDTNCQHNIVVDYIDISPDDGCNIRFCDICMKTFP